MIHTGQNFQLLDDLQPKSSIPFEMIWVNEGEFLMGNTSNNHYRDPNNYQNLSAPQFKSKINKGFWLGQYPVTYAHWKVITKQDLPYKNNAPLCGISWIEAIKYCQFLNALYKDKLPNGYVFSLPTEAQWEYACRAGTTTKHYVGNTEQELLKIGQFEYKQQDLFYLSDTEVGKKQSNLWKFHDMISNSHEWCFDIATDYPYHLSSVIQDWVGNQSDYWVNEYYPDKPESYQGKSRIVRGHKYSYYRLRSNANLHELELYQWPVGFRVALRPITEWDLNDPLLKKEGISLFEKPTKSIIPPPIFSSNKTEEKVEVVKEPQVTKVEEKKPKSKPTVSAQDKKEPPQGVANFSKYVQTEFADLTEKYQLNFHQSSTITVAFSINKTKVINVCGCQIAQYISRYLSGGFNTYIVFPEVEDILTKILVKHGVIGDSALENYQPTLRISIEETRDIDLQSLKHDLAINNPADAEVFVEKYREFFLNIALPFFEEWSDLRKVSSFLGTIPPDDCLKYMHDGLYKKAVIWKLCNHPDYELHMDDIYGYFMDEYKRLPNDRRAKSDAGAIQELREVLDKTEPIYL